LHEQSLLEEKDKFNNDTNIEYLLSGELSGLLNNIDATEKKGDWPGAFEYYQRVFDSAKDEIYQMPDRPHTFIGLRRYCLERLNALGEEQKASYRAIFDGDAMPMLRRAVEEGDRNLLVEVVRRYMLTSAGPEALRILGWQAFETASYGDAIYYWRNILKYHPAKVDASILAGLAAAYAALGEAEGLNEIAEIAKTQHAGEKAMIQGKEAVLAVFIAEKIAALGQNAPQPAQWDIPGGFESQVRIVNSLPAGARKAWSIEFPEGAVESIRYVAIDDDVLYCNDGTDVYAMSLWNGRVLWRCQPRKTALDLRQGGKVAAGWGVIKPMLEVENGTPTGVTVGKDLIYTAVYGRLLAIRRDNGRLAWYSEIVDQDMPQGMFPSLVYSAVAPLLKNDRVYSIEVRRSEGEQTFILYCRDAMTGAIKWRRELGGEIMTMPNGVAANQGIRDNLLVFTMPSLVCESEGVLYISTSGGAVAAIDRLSGDLLWNTLYHRGPDADQAPFLVDGWEYCPPVVAGGKFVVAPEDSEYLYVFDTKTGKPLWFRPRRSQQGDFRYIAAVDPRRGLIFLAGDNVAAYDLNEGRTKAEAAPLPGRAIAPGLIAKNMLYIPTTDGIAAVDMDASVASGVVKVKLLGAWKDILDANELKAETAKEKEKVAGLKPEEQQMWNDAAIEKLVLSKTAGGVAVADDVLVLSNGVRITVAYDLRGKLGALDAVINAPQGDPDGKATYKRGLLDDVSGSTEKATSDLTDALPKLRARAAAEGFDENRYVHFSGSAPASGDIGYVRYKGSPPTTLNGFSLLVIRARQMINRMSFEEAMRELGQNPGDIKFKDLFTGQADQEKVRRLLVTARDNAIDAKSYVDCQLALFVRAQKAQNWQECVDLLMQMMHDWGEASYDFSRYDPQVVTRDVVLFCTATIGDILRAHGATLYSKYDTQAAAELQAAQGKNDPDALLKVVSNYPNSVHAGKALVQAMDLAAAAGDGSREAYLAREYLWRLPDGVDRYAAMALYAEGLAKLGRIEEARLAFKEMTTRAVVENVSEFTLGGNKTGVSDYVQKQILALQGQSPALPIEIPFASVKFRQAAQISSVDYLDAAVLEPAGIAPPGLQNAIFMLYLPNTSDYAELKCMDRSTLEEIWSAEVRGIPRIAWTGCAQVAKAAGANRIRPIVVAYSGNSVVLNYGTSVSAFDPYNGGLRWLKETPLAGDIGRTYPASCITDDMVYLSSDADLTVSAINSRTGLVVWQQNIGKVGRGNMAATPSRLLVAAGDPQPMGGIKYNLFFLDKRNGQVKGIVKDVILLGMNVLTGERKLAAPTQWGLEIRPLDDKRVLVLSSDRLGLYDLEKGDTIWESTTVGPFNSTGFMAAVNQEGTYYGLPSPMKMLDVGDGICAAPFDNYNGVRIYNLEDGKVINEFKPPDGWFMWDWFLDKGQLTMFEAQPMQDAAAKGLDFMQYAYDAKTAAEICKNEFPTGRFFFRPLGGKDNVIFIKEDLSGEISGPAAVIVYKKADGKVVNAPYVINGLGHSPSSSMLGKGREFVVKGRKRVMVLRAEEEKTNNP